MTVAFGDYFLQFINVLFLLPQEGSVTALILQIENVKIVIVWLKTETHFIESQLCS